MPSRPGPGVLPAPGAVSASVPTASSSAMPTAAVPAVAGPGAPSSALRGTTPPAAEPWTAQPSQQSRSGWFPTGSGPTVAAPAPVHPEPTIHLGPWAADATLAASAALASAVPGPDAAAAGLHSPFPATGASAVVEGAVQDDDEDDEPSVRRHHPYTWLHLVVLALVAFVLGFLIVALWNQGRSNGAEGATGASGVVVQSPPVSSYTA